MKNQNVIGVGCFAKPEKLSRVLKKMVDSYTLGQFDDFELTNEHETGESEGIMLLKALIAGKKACSPWSHSASQDNLKIKKITGFFLSFSDQRLNLSIFAKSAGTSQERYTTSLEDLTRIRQKRLN